MAKTVFFCFRSEDHPWVEALLYAEHPGYEVEWYREPIRALMEGQNAEFVKRKIGDMISRTSVTVCFVSAETYKNDWVSWEINESLLHGNPVIVMGIEGVFEVDLPRILVAKQIPFHPWDPAKLDEMIAQCP